MTVATHRWEYLRPGSVLAGRYEIDREIGRGGFSVVYSAVDRTLGDRVAIKLLVPPPASAAVFRERMRREVIALRSLSHEHIVSVFDFIDDGDRSFLTMRLVDGDTLAQHVARHGPLSEEHAVRLGDQMARALTAAHERGILHRDVKPQNILMDTSGSALLTDFGSARIEDQHTLTRTGEVMGTTGYISPNVQAGGRADARDDVFALGMTLAFAVTGNDLGNAPLWLSRVIARATAANPIDRFPTAASLQHAVRSGSAGASPTVLRELELAACLVCGAPEPFGQPLCDYCRSATGTNADAILVPRGSDRAVARVPMAVSELAVARLRSAGNDAVIVPIRLAWTAIPRATWMLAVLVVAAGMGAAWMGAWRGYWPTMVVACGLLVSAERTVRRPIPMGTPRPWLPAPLHARMITTLTTLSRGRARAHFTLLTARVRSFANLAERHAELAPLRPGVEELYATACDAAQDLDAADCLLDDADASADRSGDVSRAREQMIYQFLRATAEVERMCGFALRNTDDAPLHLATTELARQADALRTVNRLLIG